MLMRDFGWKPPGGKPGQWDVLPVVLQAHPDQDPEVGGGGKGRVGARGGQNTGEGGGEGRGKETE